MNRFISTLGRHFPAAVAVLGMLGGMAVTSSAYANTAANATILNVVQVNYKDASKANAYSATATTSVTVNLVESALALSTAVDQSVASGGTATYGYTLTATANGSDVYDLLVTMPATSGVAGAAVTADIMTSDRTASASSLTIGTAASLTLGASVITGITAADTLAFPGGTLSDIAVGDVVVVNGNSYLVTGVTLGAGASHTNVGGVNQTTDGTLTAEVQGSLTLAIHPAGSNVAPAFGAGDVGTVAAEQVYLEITSTATTTGSADGTVDHTIEADSSNNSTLGVGVDNYVTTTNQTTFTGTQLSIKKEVRNVTQAGAFAATATGNPGEVLEYQVTVTNTGSGAAAEVFVTDTVPAYTTLVVTGGNFGTIFDGTNTVTLTSATDSETQPGAPTETGFGEASGTAAGSTITVYVGDNSTNALGGDVAAAAVYVIKYQVTID